MLRRQTILFGNKVYHFVREHKFGLPGEAPKLAAVSQALFCPICIRVWATLIFEGDTRVWPRAISCEFCATPLAYAPVPGSLLGEENCSCIDKSLLLALPLELLRREFALTLKAVQKWGDSQSV